MAGRAVKSFVKKSVPECPASAIRCEFDLIKKPAFLLIIARS